VPKKKVNPPLSKTHPKLAKEADGWDPKTAFAGTREIKAWKCSRGHKWKTEIKSRSQGRGCPFCSHRRVLKGFNDIATTHPDLAKQAYKWDPQTLMMGTGKRLQWICKSKHIWTATGNDRKSGYGCPYCSGRLVVVGKTDLLTTHPKIAGQLINGDSKKISFGSGKKFNWECDKKHQWSATVSERTSGGTGCPYCSNRKILKGFNDLATTHPDIAKQAKGWNPTTVGIGSNKPANWVCPEGHTWRAVVVSRARSGCPTCANKKVLKGFNDLNSKFPNIAKEADGWDPSSVTPGTNREFNWRCKLGHRWSSSVANRTGKNTTGCPYCSNNKVLVGFNDLETLFPLIASQAFDWDPKTVTWGANSRKTWICEKRHKWNAIVSSRTRPDSGSGCPYCGYKKLLKGFNDLATTHPEIAKQAKGWDPTKVITDKKTKYLWICEKKHSWKTTIGERKSGSNCPSCAISGFDPNEKAFIYFLNHPDWEMLQIGITNFPDNRLSIHKKLGWEVFEIRGPMDGHLTQQWETAILHMLKAKGADLSNKEIAGKFDGYSEAWSKSTFPVKSIKELMRLTEEFEESNK